MLLREYIERNKPDLLEGLEALQLTNSGVAHLLAVEADIVASWKKGTAVPAIYQLQLYMFLDAINKLWIRYFEEEEGDLPIATAVQFVILLLEDFSSKLDTFTNMQKEAANGAFYNRVKDHPKRSIEHLISDAHKISIGGLDIIFNAAKSAVLN